MIFQDEEIIKVIKVFLQVPFEFGSFGPVGKKYEAIKDFLKWNGLDTKYEEGIGFGKRNKNKTKSRFKYW